MHSGFPVVYGTAASRHLQIPGSSHRCLARLVFIYIFITVKQINSTSASCNTGLWNGTYRIYSRITDKFYLFVRNAGQQFSQYYSRVSSNLGSVLLIS